MRIQHNIAAMNSYRNFSANNSSLNKNLEKLSTGYKINRAGDDAAGLAISEKMRAQITGLEGATKNSKDGISLIQTAEGALTEVHDMLNRMTTLAEQSANGTYQNELDREQLQKEVDALKSEIDRIADSTNFNGLKLLDGSLSDKFETTKTLDSAITNIDQHAFVAKGASDAFKLDETKTVERPAANSEQTNAQFKVSLNAVSFSGAKAGDKLSLSINGKSFEFDLTTSTTGDGTNNVGQIGLDKLNSATDLAAAIAKNIGRTAADTAAKPYAAGNAETDKDTTADWNAAYGASDTPTAETATGATNHVVKIDDHFWQVTVGDGSTTGAKDTLIFTQVDEMENGTANLEPAYTVGLSAKRGGNDVDIITQLPNSATQVTTTGKSIGSSQQAQAEVNIDFAKLRNGDKLTAGEFTFNFQIGSTSSAPTGYDNSTANIQAGKVNIDLSDIFKEEADLSDAAKQNEAMTRIVQSMGDAVADNSAWTVGDGDVNGGIGTLHFQSKDSYTGDTSAADADKRYVGTGIKDGDDAGHGDTLIDMTTAKNIAAQFVFERQEANAATTFDLDVTKIKAGDTFTVDGKTFEFTDGPNASGSGNVAINLRDEGIAGGILSSSRADVASKMKTALDSALTVNTASGNVPKYTFTRNGDTVTLTSNEDTSTTTIEESRISADLKTPTETTYGEGLVLQIGDTADSFNKLTVSIEDMHTASLGIGDLDISTQDGAAAALDKIKTAINSVSDTRGNMGALQNRLEHTINNLGVMRENIQSAESVIRDTDVAEEMMTYTKNNILNQSAQAMLAQANQLPQGVLQLLG